MTRMTVWILMAVILLQFLVMNAMFNTQDRLERGNARVFTGLIACMKTCQQRICK